MSAKTTICPHCNGQPYDPPCRLCQGKGRVSLKTAERYARDWFAYLVHRHVQEQHRARVFRAILRERRNGLTFQQLRAALEASEWFTNNHAPRYIPPEWAKGKTVFS